MHVWRREERVKTYITHTWYEIRGAGSLTVNRTDESRKLATFVVAVTEKKTLTLARQGIFTRTQKGAGGAAEWEWSQTKSKVVSVGYKYK